MLFGVLFLYLSSVFASHYNYGTLSWTLVSPAPSRQYNVTIRQAFRRSFYTPFVALGQAIPGAASVFVFVMDSSNSPAESSFPAAIVNVDDNPLDDWFIGVLTTTISVQNPTANYRLWYYNAARLSDIVEGNHDLGFALSAVINGAATETESPRIIAGIPRLYLQFNTSNTFQIPVIAQTFNVVYKFATIQESYLIAQFPYEPADPTPVVTVTNAADKGFELNNQTGIVTWTPVVQGIYAVQFIVERLCAPEGTGVNCTQAVPTDPDADGTGAGQGPTQTNCCSRVPYDFLIVVVPPCPTCPVFTTPFPISTPVDQRIVTVTGGTPGSTLVCVTNSTPAIIFNSDLPPTWQVTYDPADSGPNKLCYNLSWTDITEDQVVCYSAQTLGSTNVSIGQYCITYRVQYPVTVIIGNYGLFDNLPYYALPSQLGRTITIQLNISSQGPYNFGSGQVTVTESAATAENGVTNLALLSVAGSQKFVSVSFTVNWQVLGPHDITVNYPGTPRLLNTTATFRLVLHYYPRDGGRFLISTQAAVPHSQVYFWGPDWSSRNNISDQAPLDFQGWSTALLQLQCTYTQPENGGPPGQVFSYLGVPTLGQLSQPNSRLVTKFAVITPNNDYLGCFKDKGGSARDLPVQAYQGSDNSLDNCQFQCALGNYLYFGVQFGTQCWCGNSYGAYGPSTACTLPCTGDSTQICGGALANNVYRNSGYHGCWKDKTAARDLSVFIGNNASQTIEGCRASCASQSFQYFSVQFGTQCFCGNKYGSYGLATNCNKPCAGDATEICGGVGSNAIYNVYKDAAVYIGCFNDKVAKRDLSHKMTVSPLTVRGCQQACSNANYTYFGVQFGTQCFCDNTYGAYGNVSDASCNTPCAGNSNQICGATLLNSVYAISAGAGNVYGTYCPFNPLNYTDTVKPVP